MYNHYSPPASDTSGSFHRNRFSSKFLASGEAGSGQPPREHLEPRVPAQLPLSYMTGASQIPSLASISPSVKQGWGVEQLVPRAPQPCSIFRGCIWSCKSGFFVTGSILYTKLRQHWSWIQILM